MSATALLPVRRRGAPWWALSLAASLAAGALSWSFFAHPLRPWPDQGHMLQAARQHAQGLGLTVPVSGDDLTSDPRERLTYFPPLYPWLVSVLLRQGLEPSPAVKAVNALALLAGTLGWCRLAAGALDSSSLRWLFAVLLVVAGGAQVPKGGTADYLMWAGVPWWCLCLLRSRPTGGQPALPAALAWGTAAGGLAALLVGVRWAALFLAPAALAVALLGRLTAPGGGPVGRRRFEHLAPAVLAALWPLVTYLAIGALNRRLSGSAGSLLAHLESHWNPRRLLTLYPFEALCTLPLALEPLLARAWRAAAAGLHSPGLHAAWHVLLPAAAWLVLVVAARRATLRERRVPAARDPERDRLRAQGTALLELAGATLATLLAFLAWMSLHHTWSFAAWSYLDEPRYYRPLAPLAALLWLLLLDRLPRASRVRTLGVLLPLAGALYLLQALARGATLRAHDESWELVQRVRAATAGPGLQVLVDQDVSDYVLFAGDHLRLRTYPDPERVARLGASRPAQLWLVRRLRERTAYMLDPDWDRRRFEALRQRFGAERYWRSSAGGYELWRASLGPPVGR